MIFCNQNSKTALLALALGLVFGMPAAAQDRSDVREVLNRAETQAARRAVEDLLGSIGGIGRAEAQTLPPRAETAPGQSTAQPPAPQTPVTAGGTAPVTVAQSSTPSAPAVTGSPIGAGGPNAVVAAPGTPTQPSMIVRVPDATEAGTAAATANAPAGTEAGTAAPTTGSAPGRALSTAAPGVTIGRSPAPGGAVALRPAGGAPVSVVRVAAGRMVGTEWCPPTR